MRTFKKLYFVELRNNVQQQAYLEFDPQNNKFLIHTLVDVNDGQICILVGCYNWSKRHMYYVLTTPDMRYFCLGRQELKFYAKLLSTEKALFLK